MRAFDFYTKSYHTAKYMEQRAGNENSSDQSPEVIQGALKRYVRLISDFENYATTGVLSVELEGLLLDGHINASILSEQGKAEVSSWVKTFTATIKGTRWIVDSQNMGITFNQAGLKKHLDTVEGAIDALLLAVELLASPK